MLPENDGYQPAQLFTVEQANAMLPLVRAIAQDIADLFRDLMERQQRLAESSHTRESAAGDPYADELMDADRDLQRDREKLREYVRELQQLGVELKHPGEGLLDFPSEMNGRIVYLCWKLGEPEVKHWHELDAGFAGRQCLEMEEAR